MRYQFNVIGPKGQSDFLDEAADAVMFGADLLPLSGKHVGCTYASRLERGLSVTWSRDDKTVVIVPIEVPERRA